jgi:hypothetical protein
VVVSVVAVAFVIVLSIFTYLYYMGSFQHHITFFFNVNIQCDSNVLFILRKVTATFTRTINTNEMTTKSTRFLSVLDGAMLLGGPEELYVYNVTDERLIYSDITPMNTNWFEL